MDQYGNPETADVPRKKRRGWIVLIIIAALLVVMVPIGLVLAALVYFRCSEPVGLSQYEEDLYAKSMETSPSPHPPWQVDQVATEQLKLTLSVVSVRLVKRAEVPPKLAGSLGAGKELLAIKLKLANASKGRILDHAKLEGSMLSDNFGNRMSTAPDRTGTGEIKPGNAAEFTVWAVAPRVDNASDFKGHLTLTTWLANTGQSEEFELNFKSSDIQNQQGSNP